MYIGWENAYGRTPPTQETLVTKRFSRPSVFYNPTMPLEPTMKIMVYVSTLSLSKDMKDDKSVKIGGYTRREIVVRRPRIWWGLEWLWMHERMK
jgi:hypothetical protein